MNYSCKQRSFQQTGTHIEYSFSNIDLLTSVAFTNIAVCGYKHAMNSNL